MGLVSLCISDAPVNLDTISTDGLALQSLNFNKRHLGIIQGGVPCLTRDTKFSNTMKIQY